MDIILFVLIIAGILVATVIFSALAYWCLKEDYVRLKRDLDRVEESLRNKASSECIKSLKAQVDDFKLAIGYTACTKSYDDWHGSSVHMYYVKPQHSLNERFEALLDHMKVQVDHQVAQVAKPVIKPIKTTRSKK